MDAAQRACAPLAVATPVARGDPGRGSEREPRQQQAGGQEGEQAGQPSGEDVERAAQEALEGERSGRRPVGDCARIVCRRERGVLGDAVVGHPVPVLELIDDHGL